MTQQNLSGFDWLAQQVGFEQGEAADTTEAARQAQQEQMETAQMIKRALIDNPDGAILLDYLTQATIMTPMMAVSRSLPTDGEVALSPADWAYVREGQNSVIHFLRNQISLAMNPPKTEKETDE